jgi:hypothetical protein
VVGRSGGDDGQVGGFRVVEAVEQRGGDASAMRTGMDHESADVHGPLGLPVPGHRSGETDLIVEAEEGLAAVA